MFIWAAKLQNYYEKAASFIDDVWTINRKFVNLPL